jgi:hypothetical protein
MREKHHFLMTCSFDNNFFCVLLLIRCWTFDVRCSTFVFRQNKFHTRNLYFHALDLLQIRFDDGAYLRRLPIGLFGAFRPGERQMPHFSGLLMMPSSRSRYSRNISQVGNIEEIYPFDSKTWIISSYGFGIIGCVRFRPHPASSAAQYLPRNTPIQIESPTYAHRNPAAVCE